MGTTSVQALFLAAPIAPMQVLSYADTATAAAEVNMKYMFVLLV